MNVMKSVEFDWDAGNLEHTAKHGVTPSEIEFALSNDPMVQTDPYPAEIEQRWRGVGQTAKGRMLFVVFIFREISEVLKIRPLSARYMHDKEVKKYEQQRQK